VYILWECPSARDVWCMGSIKFQKISNKGNDFLAIVEEMFSKCQPEELRHFAGIVRRMWLRRNEVVHGGPFLHPNLPVQNAVHAAEEFAELSQIGKQKLGDRRKADGQKWCAPSPGWVTLNWDASTERAGAYGLWRTCVG
jgi:hypothetical protein